MQLKRLAILTDEAEKNLEAIIYDKSKKDIFKAVSKTIKLMESNLRHPSLNTHEFEGLISPLGEKVFVAYAQNKTPQALQNIMVLWSR